MFQIFYLRTLFAMLVPLIAMMSFASVLAQNPDQADSSPSEHAIDECSIFGVAKANALSWRSGDVLLRKTTSFDNVEFAPDGASTGANVETVTLNRLLFDHENNRFASLVFRKKNVVDIGNPNMGEPVAATTTFFFGTYADEASDKVLQFQQGGLDSYPHSTWTIYQTLVPDFRGCWLAEGSGFKIFLKSIEALESGREYVGSSVEESAIKVEFKGPSTNATRFQFFTIDPETQMPIEQKIQYDDIDGVKKRVDGSSTKIQWKLIEGVYVPQKIEIGRRVNIRVNREPQNGFQHTTWEFHWFAFNDEGKTNELLVNGKCFEDLQTFMSLVEPKQAGATSLLDEPTTSNEAVDTLNSSEK
jgi:hypothetical protein